MVTLPPVAVAGTTTEVSTGSVAVGPIPPGSVVTVPPCADTLPDPLSGGVLLACGVTGLEGCEGALEPSPFTDVTVKVYVVPLTRPPMRTPVVVPATLAATPPGDAVTS